MSAICDQPKERVRELLCEYEDLLEDIESAIRYARREGRFCDDGKIMVRELRRAMHDFQNKLVWLEQDIG